MECLTRFILRVECDNILSCTPFAEHNLTSHLPWVRIEHDAPVHGHPLVPLRGQYIRIVRRPRVWVGNRGRRTSRDDFLPHQPRGRGQLLRRYQLLYGFTFDLDVDHIGGPVEVQRMRSTTAQWRRFPAHYIEHFHLRTWDGGRGGIAWFRCLSSLHNWMPMQPANQFDVELAGSVPTNVSRRSRGDNFKLKSLSIC